MLNQKVVSLISLIAAAASSLVFLGCESSSSSIVSANNPSLNTVAASAHSTFITTPTIDITLTDSGDVISLDVDSVDSITNMTTYIGTDDMGDPVNPATTEISLGAVVSDFTISYIDNGANGEYVMAASQTSNEAFTIQYERDGNEISAVVRTLNGVEVATAAAAGAWETQYPATQPTNMTSLLVIIALSASTACDPNWSGARKGCIELCGKGMVADFDYSCNPTTGEVSVGCECKP